MFTAKDFTERRIKLLDSLPEKIATVVVSGREVLWRSQNVPMELFQFSDMIYLTGYDKVSGTLVMTKDNNVYKSVLFLPTKDKFLDPNAFGRISFEETFKNSGVDEVLPLTSLPKYLPDLLKSRQVYCSFPPQQSGIPPFKNLGPFMDKLRIVKSQKEIELIKKACDISRVAITKALEGVTPGTNEAEIEHKFYHEISKGGSNTLAYPTVVASGPNALCLHYLENNRPVQDGEAIMMDAACSYQHYCSDFTRSIGVGKITEVKRCVLEMVDSVKNFIVKHARARAFQTLNQVHYTSEQLLLRGLKEIGIDYNPYKIRQIYPHASSHWIGMDVHDCDSIGFDYQLRKGNVFSVEPGLYFDPYYPETPKELVGLGCRFEDTVIIE